MHKGKREEAKKENVEKTLPERQGGDREEKDKGCTRVERRQEEEGERGGKVVDDDSKEWMATVKMEGRLGRENECDIRGRDRNR